MKDFWTYLGIPMNSSSENHRDAGNAAVSVLVVVSLTSFFGAVHAPNNADFFFYGLICATSLVSGFYALIRFRFSRSLQEAEKYYFYARGGAVFASIHLLLIASYSNSVFSCLLGLYFVFIPSTIELRDRATRVSAS